MDNQGKTAEQIVAIQAEALQDQQSRGFGIGGLVGGQGAGIFDSPALQQFAQARQQMALSSQILAAQVARERTNDAGLLGSPIKKSKDYSEHLTRKDEKILPIEKR